MGRAKDAPLSMLGEFGGTDSWCSPAPIRDGLYEFYDGIPDFDPCTNANAIIDAKVKYFEMGTLRPWKGRGYKNPPYSNTAIFTSHGLDEIYARRCTELVDLVMLSPSTSWWLEACGVMHAKASPAFRRRIAGRWGITDKHNLTPNPEIIVTPRLRFIGDKAMGARFDTALFYYGRRRREFHKAFKHLTRWTTRGRIDD